MKKTFGIMGTGLLLASNVLVSFSNVSFAVSCGDRTSEEIEVEGCYVLKHYYRNYNCESHYEGADLLSYKCDAERGTVDLRDAPLEDGQYIAYIGEDAFSGTNVTKVIIPSTVMGIGAGAFCNVKREGNPTCGDGIIDKELGEECDDGSSDSGNGYTKCNLNCTIMDLPNCGNGQEDLGETCGNCPEDIYCGKSIDGLDDENSGGSELLLKGQLPVEEIDESKSNDSDFVVVDFLSGMNNEFDIISLSNACAKLQEYTVTFITENGVRTGETFNQHILPFIIPEAPEKEGFIGTWYLGDEIFDFNSQITDNITLVYKYEKGGIEYDQENGWIKVSLGEQEIIVKDKDQGAEISMWEVVPDWYFDFMEYENDLRDNFDIIYEERSNLLLNWVKVNVGNFDSLDAFYDYLAEDIQSDLKLVRMVGDYYYRGNNVGFNAKDALLDEENQSIDFSKMNNLDFPEGFDHGYIGLSGGNDWTVGSNDTPCSGSKGEYLPSPDDWKLAIELRARINGYELYYDEENGEYYFDDSSAIQAVSMDFGVAGVPAVRINQNQASFVNNLYYQGSFDNGKIGYMTNYGVSFLDTSNLNGNENSIAMPIRCFVKPQFEVSFEVNGGTDVVTQRIFSGDNAVEPEEVQKENAEFLGWFTEDGAKFKFDTPITSDITLYAKWQEKKSNSSYSGGGGGKSSSSNTAKTEDKVHNSADDKVTSKSEEKVKNNQIDIVNSKTQIEKKSDELSQKVVYHPDNTLTEEEQAYDFAHTYGITTKTSVENAKMDNSLTRIQMAKMLSQYAVNVLGKEPDVSKGVTRFSDVTNKMNKDYDNGVNLAYQLGIMGQNMKDNKFRPNDEVTRAEFVTALSRMLYNTSDGEYKSTPKYYIHHMQKLKSEGIITNDNPKMKEKRGYVMLMLLRSVK